MSMFEKILLQELAEAKKSMMPQKPATTQPTNNQEKYQGLLEKLKNKNGNQEPIKKDQEKNKKVEEPNMLPHSIKVGETMLTREDLARAIKQKAILEKRLKGQSANERALKMRMAKDQKRREKIEVKKEKEKLQNKKLEQKEKKNIEKKDIVIELKAQLERLTADFAKLRGDNKCDVAKEASEEEEELSEE